MTDEMRVSFGFPLRVSVHTDMGRVRANNEDSHGFAWLSDGSLFVIVADGMGGHDAGEVASGLAVQVLEEVVSRDLEMDPRERLYNGLLEANEAILQEGRASGTRGMGTTAIATLCRGAEVYIGLVGDSRLYHIRKGQLIWRTLDHTRVQMLIDQGQVPEVAARAHPESGMLTRALGHSKMADGRPLVPDVLAEPIHIMRDDALVLCSDGLHDLVEDWEIGRIIAGKSPAHAARDLVKVAVERGGHDNITVAVITAGERTLEFEEPEPQATNASEDALPEVEIDEELAPITPAPSAPSLPAPALPVQAHPASPAALPPAPPSAAPVARAAAPPEPLSGAISSARLAPPDSLQPAPLAPLPLAATASPSPSEEATVVRPTAAASLELAEQAEIAEPQAGKRGLFFGLAAVTAAGLVAGGAVLVIAIIAAIWAYSSM